MTKVAIWCRHQGDNIIGIGPHIPWDVPSDVRKFQRVVDGCEIVVGRATYETLPASFDEQFLWVLSSQSDYELRNPKKHHLVNKINDFKDFEDDLYICGGAKVYYDFMSTSPKLLPDIIVDCVYHGALAAYAGEAADITPCVEIMNKKYLKISADYEQDNVTTALYIKRGDFVEQSVLKRILAIIEQKN